MAEVDPAAPPAGFMRDQAGNLSSKRLAAAFALLNLAGLTWVGLLTKHQLPTDALYLWGTIALGSLGLTIPEWFATRPGAAAK